MSRHLGTTGTTAASGGNQVATAPLGMAQKQSLRGGWVKLSERRATRRATAGEGARAVGAEAQGAAVHRASGGKQVATAERAPMSPAWQPGCHGHDRAPMLPLGAATASTRRSGGNQVSTAPNLTAARPCLVGLPSPWIRGQETWRSAVGEQPGPSAPTTAQRTGHRRRRGNQVSTVAWVSTPQARNPGLPGWHRRLFLRLDTGTGSVRRNVNENLVSTLLEIQHG